MAKWTLLYCNISVGITSFKIELKMIRKKEGVGGGGQGNHIPIEW